MAHYRDDVSFMSLYGTDVSSCHLLNESLARMMNQMCIQNGECFLMNTNILFKAETTVLNECQV